MFKTPGQALPASDDFLDDDVEGECGNGEVDPRFVNGSEHDFHLQPSSSAINASVS